VDRKTVIAGLKVCEEVDNAIDGGELDLAATTAVPLRKLAVELDNGQADGVYANVVDLLCEALLSGDVRVATLSLVMFYMKLYGASSNSVDPAGPPALPN
jgi:hypothetical protein